MLERDFQKKVIDELHSIFPGCIVLKNDEQYLQGIPDLTIFYNDRYALLENKKSLKSSYRPNQLYYIDKFDAMSFARVICPENKDDVLLELKKFFNSERSES